MSLEKLLITGVSVVAAMIAVPIATWLLYRLVYETKRRKAIRAVARECGAEYLGNAAGKLEGLAHFRLFDRGGVFDPRPRKRIRNVVARRFDDVVVTVFDYQWRGCDSGEDIDPRERRTVVHVTSDRLQLPRFDVRSNGLYLKLTSKFRPKVQLDCHPEFARRYDLSCEEDDRIRELFHPGVLELIARDPRKLQFEGADEGFIFLVVARNFFGEGRLSPQDLPRLFEFATALCLQLLEAPQGMPTGVDESADAGVVA